MASLIRVFGRIGLLSFGGPAAQIALMHRELVEARPWLSEQTYLRALSLCMLLPGPEAMQLAIYAGWRLRGTPGGLVAGLLFVVPGAVVILALALGYAVWGDLPLVQAAFVGIKAAVIVIVVQALLKVARRALTGLAAWGLACAAFVALFVLGLPFPLIVLVAGLYGFAAARGQSAPQVVAAPARTAPRSALTLATWGGLWALPLLALWLGNHAFLLDVGLFFSKLAIVTFGGAYAVLAYMTQTVVADYGWITTEAMIDALGLAETTPGPLILVTEFVALLAGFAQGGVMGALAAGAVALWVTFTPCFLWIFLAGPYLDHLATRPRLSAALHAITAAVVGVIANLSLWFAVHVLFREVDTGVWLALPDPRWSSLDVQALVLMLAAAGLMLGARRGMVETLGLLALAGIGLDLL
ncbi:chromate efflux transporter [Sulfitobacter sabulilitoris]|uniref:Chromate efflux transporter n=1 Tax=Sulfitobacter sabulilitoris TaxID=2562655 RepID=A0A5S3PMV7_9RHOB|nr:chromate efflux transporter [Sulfitobacter sabulilitoris]TMM55606.1 chromate efflux transporter [Sulfitobacter sabulilitoris]